MIRYALRCTCGHDFDAWFNNAAAYDEQAERGLIDCPLCGGREVVKAPMAPAVSRARSGAAERAPIEPSSSQPGEPAPAQVRAALMAFARHVKREAEDTGDKFVDEARKIHAGESPERAIWGRASIADARDLHDDGIKVLPLPDVPDHDA